MSTPEVPAVGVYVIVTGTGLPAGLGVTLTCPRTSSWASGAVTLARIGPAMSRGTVRTLDR